jgi:hypothetical protein
MTRDSLIWKILFYGGIVFAVALEAFSALTPEMAAELGLSARVLAWLRIFYVIFISAGGKLGLSFLPKKTDPMTVDRTKLGIGAFLAVYVLAGQSMGCAPKTKHVLTVADVAIYSTLKSISDTEIDLSNNNAISKEQSAAINEKLLPIIRTGKEINAVLGTWPGTTPIPAEISRLVWQLNELLSEVSKVIPDGPAKSILLDVLARAQQAVLALLAIM